MSRYKYEYSFIKNEKERKEHKSEKEEDKSNKEENQKVSHVIEEGEDVTPQKTFEPPKKRYLKQQSKLESLHSVPFHMTLRSAVKQYIT